jgi:aspartyl-tRNA(Asn)/glutamyl-tRNA(Gln) amidotransferase subunit C
MLNMLSKEEVIKIATLARIDLSEAEVEKFQQDLTAVLDYVAELEKVDVSGVGEVFEVTGLVNVQRDDRVVPVADDTKELIFKNAPELQDGYYKVKSIL